MGQSEAPEPSHGDLAEGSHLAEGTQIAGSDDSQEPRGQVLEEIVVTAGKREDRLQEVPIAVTAVSGETLDELSLSSNRELAGLTPNLVIKTSFSRSNPTFFLRGVGINDFNVNVSGAVGIYTDEVYLSSPAGQIFQMFDLERVEVLRGPQGTLFGKNTTGGAIHFLSRRPGGDRGGFARFTFGRFEQVGFEGAFETPLKEGSLHALRVSAVSERRNGTTRNLVGGGDENDVDARAARVQLRLLPNDSTSVLLHARSGVNRTGFVGEQRGLLDGTDVLGYREDPRPFVGAYNRDTREDLDLLDAGVTVDWTGPGFALTSISAVGRTERDVLEDADESPGQILEILWGSDSHQVSQEIRLTSTGSGRLSWIAGLFFLDESLEVDNSFDLLRDLRPFVGFDPEIPVALIRQRYDQETTSLAAFGQLTYRLAPALTFTVGLRQTSEKRDLRLDSAFEEPDFTVPLIEGLHNDITSDDLSGEVSLAYDLAPQTMVYGKVSRGFKSGGFNGGALFFAEEARPVRPELLHAFEVGIKSRTLGGRLEVDAAAFYYDYQDLQVFNLDNVGGIPIQVLENASDARISGLEMELRAQPLDSLRLEVGLGLLSTEYRDFVLSDGTDFSGNDLVGAPDWSLHAAIEDRQEIGGGQLALRLGWSAQADQFYDVTNDPLIGESSYGLLSGRVAYEMGHGHYTVALWGKNLADKQYLTEVVDLSDFGFHQLFRGEPRSFGVELGLHLP